MLPARSRIPRAASLLGATVATLLAVASGCFEIAGYGDFEFIDGRYLDHIQYSLLRWEVIGDAQEPR